MQVRIEVICSNKGCDNLVVKRIDEKYLKNGRPTVSSYCKACARENRARHNSGRRIKEAKILHNDELWNDVRLLTPQEISECEKLYQPPLGRTSPLFHLDCCG